MGGTAVTTTIVVTINNYGHGRGSDMASYSRIDKEQKAKIRNRYNQVHTWPGTPYEKVTKTQGYIKHKRANRSALS